MNILLFPLKTYPQNKACGREEDFKRAGKIYIHFIYICENLSNTTISLPFSKEKFAQIFFGGGTLWHMEFPKPRTESKPYPQPVPQLWQRQILNPLFWAGDQTHTSAKPQDTAVGSLTHYATAGTPGQIIFKTLPCSPTCLIITTHSILK